MNARILVMPRVLLPVVIAALVLSSCAAFGISEARKREADARMKMGVTYLQQDNLPMAMKELIRASELDPSNPEVDMILGMTYRARGDGGQAEESLRRAIDKKPDFADAHNNLGIVLADRGAWDEAVREFKSAYENVQYQTPERAIYNSAEAYRHKGDTDRAEDQYRQALKVNPGYGPACKSLSSMLFEKGRARDAANTMVQCLQSVPNYAEGWMQLGRIYVSMRRHSEAVDAFKTVLSISEDSDIRDQASGYLTVLGTERRR